MHEMNNMMIKSLYDLSMYIHSLILTKILTKKNHRINIKYYSLNS